MADSEGLRIHLKRRIKGETSSGNLVKNLSSVVTESLKIHDILNDKLNCVFKPLMS